MPHLVGAVGLSPDVDARALADAIAGASDRFDTLQATDVVSTAALAVRVLLRTAHVRANGQPSDAGGITVIGDANYADAGAVDRVRHAIEGGKPMGREVFGRQLAVQPDADGRGVTLWTDFVGARPLFIGQLPSALVFGTDFGAVASVMGEHLTLDAEQALMELAFGASTGGRTVFDEVRIASPGAVLHLGKGGIERRAYERMAFGDRFVGATDEQKFAALDDVFARIVEHGIRPFSDELMVSLSTGFDSRYGLALATTNGLRPNCHTFGHPDSLEVFGAERVAARAGLDTSVFDIPQAGWASWRAFVQLVGNSGNVQWCGWGDAWCRYLAERGRAVMIGYLGDACSGGTALGFFSDRAAKAGAGGHPENGAPAGDWLSHLAAAWGRWDVTTRDSAPQHVRREWGDRGLDILRSMVEPTFSEFDFTQSHQKPHCLNIYARQRLHTSTQANLLASFVTPVTFLYNAALLDLCGNLEQADLENQRLYIAYAHSRFPKLFAKERKQVRYSLVERVANRVRAVAGMRNTPGARPPPVDRNLIIGPNRSNIVALARRCGEVASPVIDVERFIDIVNGYSGGQGRDSAGIIMTTNLLHLLDVGSAVSPSP